MELKGKDRRYLRSLANQLKESVLISHSGPNANELSKISSQLKCDGLVKVRLHKALKSQRKDIAQMLASKTSSELIQLFGQTVLLFQSHANAKIKLNNELSD